MSKIEAIQKMLETEPEDNFLNHALALEYIKAGDELKAKMLFENILKRSPEFIGSYYHLARLLEKDDAEAATKWYEKGMEVAKQLNDKHSYNELKSAYEYFSY